MIAITQLAAEKNLPREVVLQAMEAALVSAYKKDVQLQGNVAVKIDRETGDHHVYSRTISRSRPRTEISLRTRAIAPRQPGERPGEVQPVRRRRIAAQTASGRVQRLLRPSADVFESFEPRRLVSRRHPSMSETHHGVSQTDAVFPITDRSATTLSGGQRMKFYLLEVHRSIRGPQLILSRTHKNLLKRLFELEVPEIYRGVVEIKSIAREAGYRSKVAVSARQEGVDPVGSCVGLRASASRTSSTSSTETHRRHQWTRAPNFVANALSPRRFSSGRNE